jgi:hypothetical protein
MSLREGGTVIIHLPMGGDWTMALEPTSCGERQTSTPKYPRTQEIVELASVQKCTIFCTGIGKSGRRWYDRAEFVSSGQTFN